MLKTRFIVGVKIFIHVTTWSAKSLPAIPITSGAAQQLKAKIFRFISPCPLKKCVAIRQVCTRTPEANKTLSGILSNGVITAE